MTAPVNQQIEADPQVAPEGVHRPVGPHPGDEPLGNPGSRWIAVLTSVCLLALAGVAARDLWYHFYENEDPTQSWIGQTLNFLGSFVADAVAVTIAVVLAIIGLTLLVYAFKPHPHTHVRVNSPVSIWTRPVDIARKATDTTRRDVGGEHVRSKADRKKVTVELTDDGTGPSLQERVTRSLNNEFKGLAHPPAVSVKVRPNPAQNQPVQGAQPQPAQVVETQAVQSNPDGSQTVITQTTETTENSEVQR